MGKQLAITSGGTHLIGKKLYITDDNLVHRKAKKAYLTVLNFAKRDLPDGYTQVEYIESSGTQYIDTGFKPKYSSRVVMDVSGVGTASQFLFGARNAASSTAAQQFNVYRNSATAVRSDYFGSNKTASVADASVRTVVDKNGNVTTMYGQTITNTAVSSGTSDYNLYLLALNNIGTANNFCAAKLYSCQIYDNGTLVRDYIPCINASGVVGLYDLVNGVFYQNAGSGAFTAGNPYMLVHRLCFSGGVDVAAMEISYSASGGMQDAGIVTMGDGKQYRLLTITKSGTLTVGEDVKAEVWMCGGGTSGWPAYNSGAGGGAGAYVAQGVITLTGSMSAVIGSGGSSTAAGSICSPGGISSFGNISTKATANTTLNNLANNNGAGVSGGTGGGSAMQLTGGSGDGLTKYPFGDTAYFTKPHCAGGGAGAHAAEWYLAGSSVAYRAHGGSGGTNGGNGLQGSVAPGIPVPGSGGEYGGGQGGTINGNGGDATFYGSGGGGGAYDEYYGDIVKSGSGSGYQGVIYIRIPVEKGDSGGGGDTTEPTLIYFTIKPYNDDAWELAAQSGMTWAEWCNSSYNKPGCYIGDYEYVYFPSSGTVFKGSASVFGSDAVAANTTYTTSG